MPTYICNDYYFSFSNRDKSCRSLLSELTGWFGSGHNKTHRKKSMSGNKIWNPTKRESETESQTQAECSGEFKERLDFGWWAVAQGCALAGRTMGTFWAMQKVNEEPLGHRDQSSSMSGAAPNPWVAPSLILSHANPGEGYTHPLSNDKT